MKKLSEILSSLEADELSLLLDSIHPDPLDPTAGERIRQQVFSKAALPSRESRKSRKVLSSWRLAAAIAACVVVLVGAGFGTYAYAAEVKEYNEAVQFFSDNGLSTDGLTRGEIKAVHRDITTESFSYAKTADVIASSLTEGQIPGYEIEQAAPTPEDLEKLWAYMEANRGLILSQDTQGIHYETRREEKMDETLGFKIHDKSYLEQYDGDTLVWSVAFPEFEMWEFQVVSDGVIAYGETDTWSTTQPYDGWIAKVDTEGNLLWKRTTGNDFEKESIHAVFENAEGGYDVISRGDLYSLCVTRFTADGERVSFQQNETDKYLVPIIRQVSNGYVALLSDYNSKDCAHVVYLDSMGKALQTYYYSSEDVYYYIRDMVEFEGKIYISAYSTPSLEDETKNAGGRYDIANVQNYLHDNNIRFLTNEEATQLMRENFTAVLLVCDLQTGTPQEFYSAEGSLGGELAVSVTGQLLWDVESITRVHYSPTTSAYTYGGESYVYRYTFDESGTLLFQEKTDELRHFYK